MERHPIFAALYDGVMAVLDRLSFAPLRRRTAEAARGRTLEIGVGTGLNLPLYRNAGIVVGIEPDREMLKRARVRARARPAHLVAASGEALPFRDGAFDSVVASLVFCTIPDPAAAAREARRVLDPVAGKFHFFEHVRAAGSGMARCQDWLTPLWKKLFGGCHPNRDTLPVFERAGLNIECCEQSGAFLISGSARS